MTPARSTGAASPHAPARQHSFQSGTQATLADALFQEADELVAGFATGSACVMESAELSKGDIIRRGIIHDDRMDESRVRFVHPLEPLKRAIPFTVERLFHQGVCILREYGDEDFAGVDILLDDRPPGITGLQALLVKPDIQPPFRAELSLQTPDCVAVQAGEADENGGSLCGARSWAGARDGWARGVRGG